MFIANIVAAGALLVTVFIGGIFSDRTGRRKIFVITSTVVIAAGLVMLALVPTWPGTLLSAGLLGGGFGVYLAVDLALITEVLPSAEDSGRDLGIINIALTLPQTFAPALSALFITQLGGYADAVRHGRGGDLGQCGAGDLDQGSALAAYPIPTAEDRTKRGERSTPVVDGRRGDVESRVVVVRGAEWPAAGGRRGWSEPGAAEKASNCSSLSELRSMASKVRSRSPTTGWWTLFRPVRCSRTSWEAQSVRKRSLRVASSPTRSLRIPVVRDWPASARSRATIWRALPSQSR